MTVHKQASANRKVLEVDEAASGRLDTWLPAALEGEISRSRAKALIEGGAVSINGTVITEPKKEDPSGR